MARKTTSTEKAPEARRKTSAKKAAESQLALPVIGKAEKPEAEKPVRSKKTAAKEKPVATSPKAKTAKTAAKSETKTAKRTAKSAAKSETKTAKRTAKSDAKKSAAASKTKGGQKATGEKTAKKAVSGAKKADTRMTAKTTARAADSQAKVSPPPRKAVKKAAGVNSGLQARRDQPDVINLSPTVLDAYTVYTLYVLSDRVVPTMDGFKPVERRILYSMHKEGGRNWRKSARAVGSTMGLYHPHGDQSIYGTLANMVVPWKNNIPLIDGQGNFGSLDGSNPAAMRYTECRLAEIAEEIATGDLAFDGVVPMQPNYDDTRQEPAYLPVAANLLLINGTFGIAPTLRCNIPPHNPVEVMAATRYVAGCKPGKVDAEKILDMIPAPDYPVDSVILKSDLPAVRDVLRTGRGSFTVYAPVTINGERSRTFVIEGLPPQTTIAAMVESVSAHENVTNAQDESDEDNPVRIVVSCNRPAIEIIDDLYKKTKMAQNVPCDWYVIAESGELVSTNLVDLVIRFNQFRQGILERRIRAEIEQRELSIGRKQAVQAILADLDRFIKIVRESKDRAAASKEVAAAFKVESWQADYVLGMPIATLTKQERHKIDQELASLKKDKARLERDLKRLPELVVEEQGALETKVKSLHPLGGERHTLILDKPYRVTKS